LFLIVLSVTETNQTEKLKAEIDEKAFASHEIHSASASAAFLS